MTSHAPASRSDQGVVRMDESGDEYFCCCVCCRTACATLMAATTSSSSGFSSKAFLHTRTHAAPLLLIRRCCHAQLRNVMSGACMHVRKTHGEVHD